VGLRHGLVGYPQAHHSNRLTLRNVKGDTINGCVFDIETTELEAVGAGIMLCVAIRPLATGRTRVFRIDSHLFKDDDEYGKFEREEKALLEETFNELDKYDLLIGHNINKFDIPFMRSRAYAQGIPWHSSPLTYDTMMAFRRTGFRTKMNGFGKPQAGMAAVADFLGVDFVKTAVHPRAWWLSIWGNKRQRTEAMKEMVEHNEWDVITNSRIYPILLQNDPKVVIKRLP
jgi:uncharacterized protein YprB with RNaseH-like and TPR domain